MPAYCSGLLMRLLTAIELESYSIKGAATQSAAAA